MCTVLPWWQHVCWLSSGFSPGQLLLPADDRVHLPTAAIEQGWNAEQHFRMTPELAAQIAASDPEQQKGLERRERNRQSALAARSRRCASLSAALS